MTRPRALLALALSTLAVLGGVAWAQDPSAAGVSEVGGGAGAVALLAVVVRELVSFLRARDQADRTEKAQAVRDGERESLRADLARLRDLHNALSERTGRLDERMASHARQAEQQHADLTRMVDTLDDIRDRLPPRP